MGVERFHKIRLRMCYENLEECLFCDKGGWGGGWGKCPPFRPSYVVKENLNITAFVIFVCVCVCVCVFII